MLHKNVRPTKCKLQVGYFVNPPEQSRKHFQVFEFPTLHSVFHLSHHRSHWAIFEAAA